MRRRDFLTTGGLGLTAIPALLGTNSVLGVEKPVAEFAGNGKTILEEQRKIPVVRQADVVVCGAGPAGVAAAISAARKGAKTLLIDSQGCLGGIWTASLLSLILDTYQKEGLLNEIIAKLDAIPGTTRRHGAGSVNYDPETMKIVLEEMCAEAGVQIQYFTQVAGAVKDGNRIKAVITESKSGREAIAGKVFLDCTGDGDLAARAGCGFDFGNPQTGKFQPMSFIVLVTGIKASEVRPFYYEIGNDEGRQYKKNMIAEMARAGFTPSYGGPSLFIIRDDFFAMMTNHEYGFKGFDVRELTEATLRGRKEMFFQIDALRKLGAPWSNLRIVATPSLIGIREGRRIHGLYTITSEDLRIGRTHDDAVCKVHFPIDVHSTDPGKGKYVETTSFRAKPFDIPIRSLIAKEVEGLMMAGRCISGDFISHSSYRVTGNAVPMGEAAGRLAAKAAKENKTPRELVTK